MRQTLALLALLATPVMGSAQRPPIIDIHLHSYTGQLGGGPPLWAAERAHDIEASATAAEHLAATLAMMDRYNIVLAVVSGSEASLQEWKGVLGDRMIGGAFLGGDGLPEHTVPQLSEHVADGLVGVLGELGLQYEGISPADERLAPYYEWAESSGVPVALHTGLGPPGGPHSFAPRFRTTLGRPSLVEPVLARHPDLKLYLMHAGWPYLSETVAMLYIYPELYVDVGVLAWALPEPAFRNAIRELIDAGFEKRILFGTDQMVWPGAVARAIDTIEDASYLTESQKRDILYFNAARFLGLSQATMDDHHGVGR